MQKRSPGWLIPGSMALGIVGCLCGGAVAAIQEATGDACKLLTAAQVSNALGVQVDEGAYSVPGHTQLCIWSEHGKPNVSAENVQVRFMTSQQYQAAKTGPLAKGAEAGLGDEAYWTYNPALGYALSVQKGSTYFRVQSRPIPQGMARVSDTPADEAKWNDKEKTVEKTIASEVLKKL